MNIALIGMPASGKTTTANSLSKILRDFTVIDTDSLITDREKESINNIFAQKGEAYFRQVEANVLKEILNSDNQIISTGGGIIKSDDNIKILKDKSVVFYLKTDLQTLYDRAVQTSERPLLNTDDVKDRLKNLLDEREDKYVQAHYTINTENKTPDIIAKEITDKIYENSRS